MRLLRVAACAFAIACTAALCGPEARLGEECTTSTDCGFELDCIAVNVNEPDAKSCELVCDSHADCDAVFDDASIGCLDPLLGIEIEPGDDGRCGHFLSD